MILFMTAFSSLILPLQQNSSFSSSFCRGLKRKPLKTILIKKQTERWSEKVVKKSPQLFERDDPFRLDQQFLLLSAVNHNLSTNKTFFDSLSFSPFIHIEYIISTRSTKFSHQFLE